MAEPERSRTRLSMVGLVCISLFASLLVRLWYLQLVDHNEFQVRAQGYNLRVVHEEGTRGRILDRNGKVLVDNKVINVVNIDRQPLLKLVKGLSAAKSKVVLSKEFDRLAEVLTSFNSPTKAPVIERLYDDKRYGPLDLVPVASNVPAELVLYLAEHAEEYTGVVVKRTSVRVYPYGKLAAHIVGYVGQISEQKLAEVKKIGAADALSKTYQRESSIGKGGIEASAELDLRGRPSDRTIQVDAAGNYLSTVKESKPVAGDDVWLSIDINLQAQAETVLTAQLDAIRGTVNKDGKVRRAPQGSVVIVDPQDGQVLAMASYPTYDPSQLVNGIDSQLWARLNDKASGQPLFNWALQGTYAPGSTFKLFTATAAMDTGFFPAAGADYYDNGLYTISNCKGGRGGGCVKQNAGAKGTGQVNLSRAITVSSDTYFYRIGDLMWQQRGTYGETAIQDAAAKYGIGIRTGINLAGEAGGRLPTPAKMKELHNDPATAKYFPRGTWTSGDNVNMSIGQGDVLVTPLQLADAYATFANGGTRYVPQMISKVTRPKDLGADPHDPDNFTVVRTPDKTVSGTVTYVGDTYQQILTGLEGVTQSGAGTAHAPYEANKPAWPMAGKTGTAQVQGKEDTSVFVAFGPTGSPVFPPSYAIAVVIPEAGFGADASAPVAFSIMSPTSRGQVPITISPDDQKRADALAAKAAATPTTTAPTATAPASAGPTTPATTTSAAGQ